SVRPKSRASTGQACTQNGCLSSLRRSLHIVHLLALLVMSFFVITSQGQAWMQYSQPMQVSWLMTTGPSSYLVIASTGQTAAQAGKAQGQELVRGRGGGRPFEHRRLDGDPVGARQFVKGCSCVIVPILTGLHTVTAADAFRRIESDASRVCSVGAPCRDK